MVSQGFPRTCLSPRLKRDAAGSTFRTTASTRSPFFSTSPGRWMRLVHDISDTWIIPSTPGITSTKAPKSVSLVISPVTRSPGFSFATASVHGSGDIFIIDVELDDAAANLLPDQLFHLRGVPNAAARGRQESSRSHVHGEAALHGSGDAAGNDFLVFEGARESFPIARTRTRGARKCC